MNKKLFINSLVVLVFFSCTDSPSDNTGTPITQPVHQPAENEWALLPFVKVDSVNPIMRAGDGVFTCPVWKKKISWENKDVFNPAIVVKNNKVYMLFRAEDTIGKYAGTSRIGLAESTDGLHFKKQAAPVFYPDNDAQKKYEWEGGCEDPRVVEDENGTYYMTYTAYDGKTARMLIATSRDLQEVDQTRTRFCQKFQWKICKHLVEVRINSFPLRKRWKNCSH